ncbi:hypothetical protein SK128_004453, partial [Halocaridina rubra]
MSSTRSTFCSGIRAFKCQPSLSSYETFLNENKSREENKDQIVPLPERSRHLFPKKCVQQRFFCACCAFVLFQRINSKLVSFISSQMRFLLPPLVVRASKESEPTLLQEMVACLATRLRDILIDNFQHILSYIVFHLPGNEQMNVLTFIADTIDIPIKNIRRCSVQNQVNELVLGLHDHRSAVLQEFARMKCIEEENEIIGSEDPKKNSESNFMVLADVQEVADYLSPRLLGILGFLDNKLVSSSTMYKEKRSALWSLSDLILVMGKHHISSVSRKVLASLKTSLKLKDEEFYDIGCHAWKNFLRNLDESTLLGLLEEIVILIAPLVKVRPQHIAPILTDILVDMQSVRPLLRNMPLFHDDPALVRINQIIQEHQIHLSGGNDQEVVDALSSLLRGLNHENVDVRLHALTCLRITLHHNQDAVHHLTTDSDIVHPIISELFSILLGQCREVEEELHIVVAECLGLLGAIDPARFYTQTSIR